MVERWTHAPDGARCFRFGIGFAGVDLGSCLILLNDVLGGGWDGMGTGDGSGSTPALHLYKIQILRPGHTAGEHPLRARLKSIRQYALFPLVLSLRLRFPS